MRNGEGVSENGEGVSESGEGVTEILGRIREREREWGVCEGE